MIGSHYYSIGIILQYDKFSLGWLATVEFQDYGLGSTLSTCGKIKTIHAMTLAKAVDLAFCDAKKVGIQFRFHNGTKPFLIPYGNGVSNEFPMPGNWKELFKVEADKIGFLV